VLVNYVKSYFFLNLLSERTDTRTEQTDCITQQLQSDWYGFSRTGFHLYQLVLSSSTTYLTERVDILGN